MLYDLGGQFFFRQPLQHSCHLFITLVTEEISGLGIHSGSKPVSYVNIIFSFLIHLKKKQQQQRNLGRRVSCVQGENETLLAAQVSQAAYLLQELIR